LIKEDDDIERLKTRTQGVFNSGDNVKEIVGF